MSPHGINSLVGDLVEMAKATERLPQLEAELNIAHNENSSLAAQLENLKADLEQSRNYAASLEQKVRSLEVERDDASFRVLEAEDTAHVALEDAKAIRIALDHIFLKLDPPKPEPVKEPEPQQEQGKTDPDGYHPPQADDPRLPPDWKHDQAETSLIKPVGDAVHSTSEVPSGQSENHPTAETAPGQSPVEPQASALTQSGGSDHGPFFGKRYIDIDGYVSRYDWELAGGTEEDYDWRPAAPTRS